MSMSQMLLQVDAEVIGEAIQDLSAKINDLSEGSKTAEHHFERIIGSDATPDLTCDERIARLKAVVSELEGILAFASADDTQEDAPALPGLSGHACEVLTAYMDEQEPPRLEGPHRSVGPGIPSAHLIQAAGFARSAMAEVLHALYDPSLPAPKVTFDGFFMACEESYIDAGLEPPGSLTICDAAICYLDLLVENPAEAWTTGIEIPECLETYVLRPLLDGLATERLH